jgi:copper chaperone CopZ
MGSDDSLVERVNDRPWAETQHTVGEAMMDKERVTLAVQGLGCGGGGALTAERALAHLKGVSSVYVNPATEMAYVEYDPSVVSPDDLVRAVGEVGLRAGDLTRR